jgi:peptidoglycan/xylan/chitin deacetylase (PgdA/CDA1 family)
MNVVEIVVPLLLLVVAGYFTVEYSLLVPARRGLPVLMYHKVAEKDPDGLTVTTEQLDLQLMYMKEKGYHAITFAQLKELVNDGAKLPKKTVILTFDDAYRSFRDLALPLLKKHGFTATLFVPVAYMGKTNIWDHGSDPILTAEEMKQLANREEAEIGLHSFLHRSYGDMAPADMEEDLQNCYSTLAFHAVPFVKVLAYPYGGFPKKDKQLKGEMGEVFRKMNLAFALRIGNRINPWPLRAPYEIQRIDIKGTDSFFVFRIKLRKGRTKLFA